MNQKIFFAFCCVVTIVFFGVSGYASGDRENTVLRMTIEETVKRALAASEELKIKENDAHKGYEVFRETRAARLPHLNAESTWTRNTDYPVSAEMCDYDMAAGVSVSQVLWSFGKVAHAVNAAKRAAEAGLLNRDAVKQEVIYGAKLSYYSVLLARHTFDITQQSYMNTVENKELLIKRSAGGRSPKHERLKMDADVASRIPYVNEARAEYNSALETFRTVISGEADSDIELVDNFTQEYGDLDYHTLETSLYKREPSLQGLDKMVEAASAAVKSKGAAFFPTVSTCASLERKGSSNDGPLPSKEELDRYAFIGIKVTIPLWNGWEDHSRFRQAVLDKENALLRRKQVEKGLCLDLKKAVLEYQQYKENLKANNDAVRLAEESFKMIRDMFESGQVTLVELNDAELLLTSQNINKQVSLFHLNAILAKIEKLTGSMY